MAKNTNRQFKIYCEQFDFTFIIYTGTPEYFAKCIKRSYPQISPTVESKEHYDGLTINCTGITFLYIKDLTDLTVIAHESFHAVCGMFSYCSDMKLDSPSMEEMFAYFQGWLSSTIYNKGKENDKNRRTRK